MAFSFGRNRALLALSTVGLLLAGCAETPMGPTVQVMPGPGKSFEQFRADQANCKGFAADQVRGQAEHANQRAVGAAALSTALGVGIGALAGSVSGNMGAGAAIGGAAGVGVGAGIGAGNSSNAQYNIQQQYDNAFAQCMFAKGEQVPGYQHYVSTPAVVPAPGGTASYGPDPALVRSTQSELIRLGYLHGAADGAMGPQTSAAIRSYEQANGLPVDGAVSQGLLARLQSTQGGGAAAASAPGWVSPTTGQPPVVTPASNPPASGAPASGGAPSGWVTPKS
jgi:hypothetical protein